MTMKHRINIRQVVVPALVLLALGCPGRVAAQGDYDLFREGAGSASLLYRGHKAYEYNLLFNGTFYWSSPVFAMGEVVYNGKAYQGILLNIDAARQDLIAKVGGGIASKVLDREYVRECSFNGSRYLNLQYIYGDQSPFGYWKVLYDGRAKVLKCVTKRLEQDLDGRKRSETNFEGNYRSDVYQTFVYSEAYCYLSDDGRIIPVKRRRDVLRLFDKPTRRDIRRHIRHQEGSGMLPFERYFTEVIQYVESR